MSTTTSTLPNLSLLRLLTKLTAPVQISVWLVAMHRRTKKKEKLISHLWDVRKEVVALLQWVTLTCFVCYIYI